MARDVEITGTQEFVALAKRLNAQGSQGRGLWRELNAEIKHAAAPMTDAVLQHLDQYVPSGYAPVLRGSLTVRVSRSTRGSGAGLKLVATAKGRGKKRQIKVINQGTLRHPVWANFSNWVSQRIRPGFWDKPLVQARAIPAKHIRRAIQNTLRKL